MTTTELTIKQIDGTASRVHEFITHPDAKNEHAIILSGNDGHPTEHFVVDHYITDGDGFGRSVCCGSKTYKTYKGALKKAAQYLEKRSNTMKTGTKAEREAAEAIMAKAEAIVECSVAAIKDATQQQNVTPNGTPESKVQKTSYVVDDKGLNKYGVEGTILFAAGQALARKKITQDGYRAVCQAEWSLDEAVAAKLLGDAVSIQEEQTIEVREVSVEEAMGELQDPPASKKANANPNKKRKTQPKKEKTDPKPSATWKITTVDEDGNDVEVLYEAISSKDLLKATKVEKDTGKSRKLLANQNNAPVKMVHSKSGKFYVSKPK